MGGPNDPNNYEEMTWLELIKLNANTAAQAICLMGAMVLLAMNAWLWAPAARDVAHSLLW